MARKTRKPKSTSPQVEDQTRSDRFQRELDEILSTCPKCSAEYARTGMFPDYPCANCLPKLERLLAWAGCDPFIDASQRSIDEARQLADPRERVLKLKSIRAGLLACLLDLQMHLGASRDFALSFPIVQHLDNLIDLGILEQSTPPTLARAEVPTFSALFGDRLPDVLEAMKDAGIRYVKGRGKRKVVAALHAACTRLEKPLPLATLWPAMLEQLFPGTTWSAKVKPIESEREREKATDYIEAYRAIMDRLK